MPKPVRSLRLSNRTWSQLEELASWLQVGDRTKVIEFLADQEHKKMQQSNEEVLSQYSIGQVISFEHPDGQGLQEAALTTFTANDRGQRDGAILKFEDGTWVEVSAKYLAE